MLATDLSRGPVPSDALGYLRAKKLKVGFDHRETWREEHVRAFTVAWSMKLEIVKTIRDEVDRALAEGRTLRDFQRTLQPTLEGRGWWGRKLVEHEGETVERQLGSPRRLKLIYDTNMRTARAAGQWQRVQRTKDVRPFLLYSLGPSERHRPLHQSWAGTLLPVDHPFWQVAYPPNGWGCKCRVRQVGNAEARRLGGETEAPVLEPVRWERKDAPERGRDGFRGIDPGWNYNPGAVRQPRPSKNFNDRDAAADLVRTRMSLTANTGVKRNVGLEDSAHRIDGAEVAKRLLGGGPAHVFLAHVDTNRLVEDALKHGEGRFDRADPEKQVLFHRITHDTGRAIGLRLTLDAPPRPIRHVELKLRQDNSGAWIYHLIPRYLPRPGESAAEDE